MKVIKVKNYEELSRTAATIIGRCYFVQTGLYPWSCYRFFPGRYLWIAGCLCLKKGILDFSHVKSVNLDEYVGLDGSNDQSYRYFMNKNLLAGKIDIKNTYVPDGTNPDTEACCEAYNTLLKNMGAADLQLLWNRT